jgi:hypothetical protein
MDKERRVVVFANLERKQTRDNKIFVARIRGLGLTAYGDSRDHAFFQLRKLFSTYIDLHRKAGTLEERLNKSKVKWCYEEEYDGDQPVLMLAANGEERVIQPKTPKKGECWQSELKMVVAR